MEQGVLVVGGGIAGIQAALDLANAGIPVTIVEKAPALGGRMSQLDKTFPTNDCSMCILSPKLVEVGRHPNIELMMSSEITHVEGQKGSFQVTVLEHPRYVDDEKCVGCGVCAEKCPVKVPDEFDMDQSERKAIYRMYPQAIPMTFVIDEKNCTYFRTGKCKACEKFCEAKAIDFDQKPHRTTLDVGAIVVGFGARPFDAKTISEYGYGVFPNVITSLELERMLTASGPTMGKILRPSDGEVPKRIAFVQCVGSRSEVYGGIYCSSVCCMYALKEAIDAHDHYPDIQSRIFCMDMRAFGKEFEDYRIRAEEEYGVGITRNNRIASVDELIKGADLVIYYSERGEIKEEVFNLVVLSIGLEPPENIEEISEILGISLNEFDFCQTNLFTPLETSVPGIFVCGSFSEPRDIPDTVAQASGAASLAGALSEKIEEGLREKEYPTEKDVEGEEPRIGVFVCRCGINIAKVVSVPEVVEFAKTLPNVVHAEENLYTCSLDTQKNIRETIEEHNLNRVIVASCSPRSYEKLFQETIREGGLNPYLFEMANIREQCSWVHKDNPKAATEKAKKLVGMAVAKAGLLQPLQTIPVTVTKSALVLGGGLSGMVTSLEIAERGYDVHLVEKTDVLGGNMRRVTHTITGEDPRAVLKEKMEACQSDSRIQIHLGTELENSEGYVGNFRSRLSDGSEIEHGVTIVATGAVEYKPQEYMYGQHPNIVTQLELEERMEEGTIDPKEVVVIQCVGSRSKDYPPCSRICCTTSIKNALEIKRRFPDSSVYIIFKDIRTYGFREKYYKQACKDGVIFIRYDDDDPPVVSVGDLLEVRTKDRFLMEDVLLRPDLIVLNAATRANPDNEKLSEILKVPLNKEKFFLEAHAKLRPVDFATDGIFVCGLAQSPKFIDENMSQASAAAARALTILSRDSLEAEAILAQVNSKECSGCGTCIANCPYGAPRMTEEGVAEVVAAACKGCGCCGATCPEKAISMMNYTDDQLLAQGRSILQGVL
ncbi:MAG: CoB--CoM heterodisulfide reductase iron-sulfur subunit A family protein [Methanomassiliicoccales archaeon]|nr:MAG: CoB--CoM heterodisulfide reductase iron-sulfur subunit A family protein [Methanomassiliicoccales archaeon]